VLGYDLGPTGVDGVFFGRTRDAVVSFQQQIGLTDDGTVGSETWAALVDATFTLGDRMLYLRSPHFHGRDVRTLQSALDVLGFATGDADGIFGRFTERAVREFQRNCGHPADGIVGPDTVRALNGLRHMWENKDSFVPRLSLIPARSIEPLLRHRVGIVAAGPTAEDIADRVVSLAHASDEGAQVFRDSGTDQVDVLIRLAAGPDERLPGVPLTVLAGDVPEAFAARLVAGLALLESSPRDVTIDLVEVGSGEAERQRAAVWILDGLCAALA
jgi:hypothetical protein